MKTTAKPAAKPAGRTAPARGPKVDPELAGYLTALGEAETMGPSYQKTPPGEYVIQMTQAETARTKAGNKWQVIFGGEIVEVRKTWPAPGEDAAADPETLAGKTHRWFSGLSPITDRETGEVKTSLAQKLSYLRNDLARAGVEFPTKDEVVSELRPGATVEDFMGFLNGPLGQVINLRIVVRVKWGKNDKDPDDPFVNTTISAPAE